MNFKSLLKYVSLRLRRRSPPAPTPQPDAPEPSKQKLARLVQLLKLGEKVAEVAPVPFLKGSIACVITVAECAQGAQSNNEDLNELALSCATLMVGITSVLQDGSRSGVTKEMHLLVENLFNTLAQIEKTTKEIVSKEGIQRYLAHQDNTERINKLHRRLAEAQLHFQTLVLIHHDKESASQDIIYDYSSIAPDEGDFYATGDQWIAFNGKHNASGEKVVVKVYKSRDLSQRHMMQERDIKAFKENWHPNLLQYIGRSQPGTEQPYTVLRGITSDHVSSYVAMKFAEDNKRGSLEALRLLKALTNALSFTVGHTNSSSFDISKIHLNDRGKLILVDLEPCLEENKKSKNDMLHWRSWQEICIELLAGNAQYEPNPSIEHSTDPTLHTRLEYLRPILGHIHYGGVRFKESSIEAAFKSEALFLSQSLRELRAGVENVLAPVGSLILHAMWRRRRELHYVAHFQDPLDIDIGDIGYIAGVPPRFTRLANVRSDVADEGANHNPPLQSFRSTPLNRWSKADVNGVTRHAFRFRDADVADLVDWRAGRPRIDNDFLLRKINMPSESGLVVDCSRAWKLLSELAGDLASAHTELPLTTSNLILVVYFKQQSGYATFRMNRKVTLDEWREVWEREGFTSPPEVIYFYESPPGGPRGVWGYFSFDPVPGSPHQRWTPDSDDAGESWGWTFHSQDWTVEISKPNVKQYIRYVQL